MGGIAAAWLVGIGIIAYRSVKTGSAPQKHAGQAGPLAPPGPGEFLFASGLFIILSLLAESERVRPFATLLAWGFDIAAFLNIGNLVQTGKGGFWPPTQISDTTIFPHAAPGNYVPVPGDQPFPPGAPTPSGSGGRPPLST